jgi:hypothetical protein
MSKSKVLNVESFEIAHFAQNKEEFISLTDMARYKDAERTNYIIQNWIRTRNAIEFIGLWEQLNNPNFKGIEFDAFKNEAGSNSFTLTPQKWIETTGAVGIISKSGRYGGTFAHKDIAFEFASWLSPTFKLYLVKEFQRLKEEETNRLKLEWNLQRTLAKVNYHIHTDAVKEKLVPPTVSKQQASFTYANEADLLNVALYGMTAKEWRDANPKLEGNIRDHSSIEQLVVLSNLESINSVLIHQNLPQGERLKQLNKIAITQMKSLVNAKGLKSLK